MYVKTLGHMAALTMLTLTDTAVRPASVPAWFMFCLGEAEWQFVYFAESTGTMNWYVMNTNSSLDDARAHFSINVTAHLKKQTILFLRRSLFHYALTRLDTSCAAFNDSTTAVMHGIDSKCALWLSRINPLKETPPLTDNPVHNSFNHHAGHHEFLLIPIGLRFWRR